MCGNDEFVRLFDPDEKTNERDLTQDPIKKRKKLMSKKAGCCVCVGGTEKEKV